MNIDNQLTHRGRHIDSSETISKDGFESEIGFAETGFRFGQSNANRGLNPKLVIVSCNVPIECDASFISCHTTM